MVQLYKLLNDSGSFNPSLVWSGSRYGVCWHDNRVGYNEIYFAILNSNGIKQ